MALQPLRSVVVTAPSRLHFGMFSFGQPGIREFGGVGAMIQSPVVRVSIRPAEQFAVTGLHARRARRFADVVIAALEQQGVLASFNGQLSAVLEIEQAPREHIGLGFGTQLGLSIAAAICAFCDVPRPPAAGLARLAGRGARSAIGTHGFDRGGLLVEAGKRRPDEISPLLARLDLPAEWRFLLLMPQRETGLAGTDEQQAFARLPAVPLETTDRLLREAMLHLLPAAAANDFDEFSASLYRFGHLAGSCFAEQQGGAYAGRRTAAVIGRLREIGIEGVGQTSWGPTVFALCQTENDARRRLQEARGLLSDGGADANADEYEFVIAAPANHGATIEIADN
jgi:beta-ribofuranosylaminobenzene 5'-phosphate synthase